MAVRIQLDNPYAHYTNLDFISGKAVLTLVSDTPITSIVVKLEGESRTRLAAPKYPHGSTDKKRTEVEVHKLLYKVETLFPSRIMKMDSGPNTYYTLSPGTYEYPFRFKFPFNNDCQQNQSLATNISLPGILLEGAHDTNKHIKRALPPSLGGYPGEADIRYYVKATVARPQFYKENFRNIVDVRFLPIEPPRAKDSGQETYARRQQQFSKSANVPEKKGLFGKVTAPSPSLLDTEVEPPRVSVDVRLPSPAIITCNEPLPLRILVKKLSDTPDIVYLQMLQIELIGYTNVRAHDLQRVESSSWVIMSQSRMNIALGAENDPIGTEYKVDAGLWNQLPLPSSVAPSFETCNLSRYYNLEVRVGLSRGSPISVKPELIVVPLRMNVEVYSGIHPPQALLDAMDGKGKRPAKVPETPAKPPRPTHPGGPSAPPAPVQQQEEPYEDAPPSYEDAMAESLAPVDGPRREYNPPQAACQGDLKAATDVKGSVGNPSNPSNPKDDERLFPDSSEQLANNMSTESLHNNFSTTPVVEGQYRHYFPEPKSPQTTSPQSPSEPEPLRGPGPRPTQGQRRITPMLGVPNRKPVPNSEKK